ncbi:MAG: FAD-dependent oxidoreductase [bacterium]
MSRRFVVVGGGLGGALMTIYLGRAGYEVDLYERRADPRRGRALEGRSINLAISARGFHALERAGLRDEILAISVPMEGRMMHSARGELTFQPYGTQKGQAIHSVSRGGLNRRLIEKAEAMPNVRVHFGQRCRSVDLENARAEFVDAESGAVTEAGADAVIGADGAFSAVRAQMQRLESFNYSQTYLDHGYKELVIPAGPGGRFQLAERALHIWPRGGFMMIALPNHDGSYTCTLFWALEGPNSFAALRTEAEVVAYFRDVFPDALPLMPTLAQDYFRNPTSALVTIRCWPWRRAGRVVLLGDAAHAVVPFYGQGANASFEDCVVLDDCLRAHGDDFEGAFAEYERSRKENVDALADLAVANFYEMRDHVASRAFLVKKRVEKILHWLFPRWFVPLYTMVSFTRIPYAEAVRRDRAQWAAIRRAAVVAGVALALLAAAAVLATR